MIKDNSQQPTESKTYKTHTYYGIDGPIEFKELLPSASDSDTNPASGEVEPNKAAGPSQRQANTQGNESECNKVLLGLDESRVADEVIEHLAKLKAIRAVYQRGGVLVNVVPITDRDLPKGLLAIRPLKEATIRERITDACELLKEIKTKDGVVFVPISPPKNIVEAIAARGYWGPIRSLAGVIQSPTLRSDGSIIQTPGYDDQTGLIYQPLGEFPTIADKPAKADALSAAIKLLDVVADFPFKSAADSSAWLAMVLTLLGRPAIAGCVPLFAIDAHVRGAGKSLLTDAASLIAYGRPAARETFTRDSEELRKRITAVAIEGRQFVLLDNVAEKLDGAALDAVITSQTWNDRLLGKSQSTGEIPLKTVWAATGNNLAFGSDLARRVLPIRLASMLENPEDRHDFQNPNLMGFIGENRGELAAAALTILRAYFVAGRPTIDTVSWGSFERWVAIVRNAIVWTGLPDPMNTREHARRQDDSADILKLLIGGLLEAGCDKHGGLTTKEIEQLLPASPMMTEAAAMICGANFNPRAFAGKLRSYQGRILGGQRIVSKDSRGSVKKWLVESANSMSGLSGLSGLFPPVVHSDSQNQDSLNSLHRVRDCGETNHSNHSNQPSPQSSNLTPCDICGGNVIAAEPINGWQNLDCQKCGKVTPRKVTANK